MGTEESGENYDNQKQNQIIEYFMVIINHNDFKLPFWLQDMER